MSEQQETPDKSFFDALAQAIEDAPPGSTIGFTREVPLPKITREVLQWMHENNMSIRFETPSGAITMSLVSSQA